MHMESLQRAATNERQLKRVLTWYRRGTIALPSLERFRFVYDFVCTRVRVCVCMCVCETVCVCMCVCETVAYCHEHLCLTIPATGCRTGTKKSRRLSVDSVT